MKREFFQIFTKVYDEIVEFSCIFRSMKNRKYFGPIPDAKTDWYAIFDQGFSFFVYILLMFYTAEFPELF